MPTFKSGAFIQQCYSVHPLSLSLKALTLPDRVVVACANCNMRHRFIARALTTRGGEEGNVERDATHDLVKCAALHPVELRVSAVDVVQDSVKFRCGECRRTYHLVVSAFETYQQDA